MHLPPQPIQVTSHAESTDFPPGTSVTFDRPDMPVFLAFEPQFIKGFQFTATLCRKTPLALLQHHGEIIPFSLDGPPQYSHERWHGMWLPQLKAPWDALSVWRTKSSDVGPVPADGGDYLPLLISLREVTEGPSSVVDKEAALRALVLLSGPRGTPYSQYINADALVDEALPRVITALPFPRNTAAELMATGFTTLRDTDDASLLRVKGVGQKMLERIREFLPTAPYSRTAVRYLSPWFAPLTEESSP